MSYLKERVSYLKGLAEGMQISESSNEGKLLLAIVDVLDDVALAIQDMEEIQDEISEQVDAIDEDLGELEKEIYDEEGCDCGSGCGCHDDEEEEEDMTADIQCPHCKEEISIDLDEVDEETDSIACPNCNEKIEIEWDCSCGECSDEE